MRRLNHIFAIAVLMAGVLSSCQKDNAYDGAEGGFKILASIERNPSTKVAYAEDSSHGMTQRWLENDIVIALGIKDGRCDTYGFNVGSIDSDGKATLGIIKSGTYSGSAKVFPEKGTKMYFFYAPGTAPSAINTSLQTLEVDLSTQPSDIIPALMVASGTVSTGDLSVVFKNKTSVIALKNPSLAYADSDYTGISMSGAGLNTKVTFSIDEDGNLVTDYGVPGDITKIVNFTTGAGGSAPSNTVVYFATCPIGSAADLTVSTSQGEKILLKSKTIETANYYYVNNPEFKILVSGMDLPEYILDASLDRPDLVDDRGIRDYPENVVLSDALPGIFTVNDAGKKVRFSKGNLQVYVYDDATQALWKFADHQYDVVGIDDGNDIVEYHNGYVDLFGWSTAISNYGIRRSENVSDYSGDLVDWGRNMYASGNWSTLTSDEFQYILNGRRDDLLGFTSVCSNASFTRFSVEGTKGLLLFPDHFEWPTMGGSPSEICLDSRYVNCLGPGDFDSSCSKSEFVRLELAGCVFLPCAGRRKGTEYESQEEGNGMYWTSKSVGAETGCDLSITGTAISINQNRDRFYGESVRLVTEVCYPIGVIDNGASYTLSTTCCPSGTTVTINFDSTAFNVAVAAGGNSVSLSGAGDTRAFQMPANPVTVTFTAI